MAYAPIAGLVPQYDEQSGWWLKFYQPSTTTPITMSIDAAGSTLLAKCELDVNGFTTTDGTALFIPHLSQNYDAYLFPTEAEADANNTINAERVAQGINPFNDDFTVIKTVLTIVEGQTTYALPFNASDESVVLINGRVQSQGSGAYSIDSNGDLVLTESLFDTDVLEVWTRAVVPSPSTQGDKDNPYTFASIRDLLNTDLTAQPLAAGNWIETQGRAKANDGGGSTFQVFADGGETVDYETIIPLKAGFLGKLINGGRTILHNGGIDIIAHRGFTGFNVEGTPYAFTAALRYGANALECDIQVTSDGYMVLYHDRDTMTDDMNGITGRVKDNTLAQVQAATFKQLAGNLLENKVNIPQYFEILDISRDNGCVIHAEIKAYRTQADIDMMVQAIVDYGLEYSIVLHSFIFSDIEYVRSINKDIKIAFLIDGYTGNDSTGTPKATGFDFIKRDKNAMLAASINTIDNPPVFPDPTVAEFQASGVEVVTWTAENAQDFNFARRNNVNGIMTDYPYAYNHPVRIKNGTRI